MVYVCAASYRIHKQDLNIHACDLEDDTGMRDRVDTKGLTIIIAVTALLCLLPPFVLISGPSIPELLVSLGLYAAICQISISKRGQFSWAHEPSLKSLLQSACLAASLAMTFYVFWRDSRKLASILSKLHLSVETGCITMGLLAFPGLLTIVESLTGSLPTHTSKTVLTKEKGRKYRPCTVLLAALALSLFVCMFIDFRPLSWYSFGTDEAVYLYIGRQMAEGKVPYNDIFDHKGIILYLAYWLGSVTTPSSYGGVWLVIVVNMAAFISITLLTSKSIGKWSPSIVPATLVLGCLIAYRFSYAICCPDGLVLPWVSLALYIYLSYFRQGHYPNWHIVLLGFAFAVIVMTKPNCVGVFIALTPFVVLDKVRARDWKALLQCIALFCIGLLLLLCVLCPYFVATGSLQNMLRYYFKFNFAYTGDRGSLRSILEVSVFMLVYSAGLPLLPVFCQYRDRAGRMNVVAYLVSVVLCSISGRPYVQYAAPLIPMVAVMLATVAEEFGHGCVDGDQELVLSHKRHLLTWAPLALAMLASIYIVNPICETKYACRDGIDDYILSNTREDADVLIIGNSVCHNLYTGRATNNKFVYQKPPVDVSAELADEFKAELQSKPPDVIIVPNGISREDDPNGVVSYVATADEYTREIYKDFMIYSRKS